MILALFRIISTELLLVIRSNGLFLNLASGSLSVSYSGSIHMQGANKIRSETFMQFKDNSPFLVTNGSPVTPITSPLLTSNYFYDLIAIWSFLCYSLTSINVVLPCLRMELILPTIFYIFFSPFCPPDSPFSWCYLMAEYKLIKLDTVIVGLKCGYLCLSYTESRDSK